MRLENNERPCLYRTYKNINFSVLFRQCFVYSPNSVQQLGPDILALGAQLYSLPLSDGEGGKIRIILGVNY